MNLYIPILLEKMELFLSVKSLTEVSLSVLTKTLLEEDIVPESKRPSANNPNTEELSSILNGNYTLEEFIKVKTVVPTLQKLITPSP